jgi:predicted glycosyltransferase involved in capsule biosynthesis
MQKDLISVCIPIYANFDRRRLQLTVKSLQAQEGVDVEIVVAEQAPEPKASYILDDSINYTFIEFDGDDIQYSCGAVRNAAVAISNGEFIFNTDADIILPNKYFLRDSLEMLRKEPKSFLYRPNLIRFPIEEVPTLTYMVHRYGFRGIVDSLMHSNNDGLFMTMNGVDRDIKVCKHPDPNHWVKVSTIYMEDYKKYNDLDKDYAMTAFTTDVHAGTHMVSKEHFESVGGYCELFTGWGYEDLDLYWKLSSNINARRFENVSVVHLDHDKPYAYYDRLEEHRITHENRQSQNLQNIIKEDIERWKLKKEKANEN